METATRSLFRVSRWDALLAGAALVEGALLAVGVAGFRLGAAALPMALLGAMGLWWTSNTISHNHLHAPLFRSRALNRAFSLYLSVLLGIPQSVWRERHLRHHAGVHARRRAPRLATVIETGVELLLIAALWAALAARFPAFFFAGYLPGYAAGLLLCQAQGHFEHAGAGEAGISHYGLVYNLFWLNDGYHVEHHRHPTEHWTRLPLRRAPIARVSALPPVLRWAERASVLNLVQARLLGWLERCALRSSLLQRYMLWTHTRAFRRLLPALAGRRLARVLVVGGGLFPRTALVLRRLLPQAEIVVVDASADHIACARGYLRDRGLDGFQFHHGRFEPGTPCDSDLVVVPLAYVGDRDALYRRSAVVVHDWIWRRRGRAGAVVSWLLCKRLNLA
jgi:hypothetical protein